MGLSQALIQKQEDTMPYLNTVWTTEVIRGFVLMGVLVLGAPLIGSFFGEPRAVLLVRVLGGSVFLRSFGNIGVVYFRKELEFHKQFVYELSGTFVDLAVAISAAFLLRSVWALVFGLLAGNLVRTVVSYFIHSYRPHLSFNREQFKELFVFGKWIIGSGSIIFLITQGDDVLVGKVLGVSALGFYQLAYRLSNLAATEIAHVISQVTLPAYSKLQSSVESLRHAYERALRMTSFLAFPMAGFIAVLAFELTKILLGERWMPMVPVIQVLCVFGAIRAINGTFGAFFHGTGMPKVITKRAAIQLLLMGAIIYPLTIKMGITGTAIAVTVPNALILILLFLKLASTLDVPFLKLLKPMQIPLIASSLMMALLMVGKSLLLLASVGGVLSLLMLGGVAYVGVAVGLGRLQWREDKLCEIAKKLTGLN